jgi:organic hydroperoxide reductase OsmC/OhrA
MSEHKATLTWKRESAAFTYDTYNREHVWKFDGGAEVRGSASPGYEGDPACVDPEEAVVAALSSCQMLTFLAIAAKKRFVVDAYDDDAVGTVEKNADGKFGLTRIALRPRIRFSGERKPTAQELEEMSHAAHDACFIANSLKASVSVQPQIV